MVKRSAFGSTGQKLERDESFCSKHLTLLIPSLPQRERNGGCGIHYKGKKVCSGVSRGAGGVENTCEREANFDLLFISYLRITVK